MRGQTSSNVIGSSCRQSERTRRPEAGGPMERTTKKRVVPWAGGNLVGLHCRINATSQCYSATLVGLMLRTGRRCVIQTRNSAAGRDSLVEHNTNARSANRENRREGYRHVDVNMQPEG